MCCFGAARDFKTCRFTESLNKGQNQSVIPKESLNKGQNQSVIPKESLNKK